MREHKITILAIGGHVGDMELTAGGVLASHSLKGDRIVTLALTAGERGVPAGRDMAEYREQKVNEAKAFAEMLGGEAIVFDTPDGELQDNEENRFKVCDVIREVRPNIIITHFKNSMHKDHMTTHRIVNDARFFAGLPSFQRELPAFFASKLYYAENWEDAVDYKPYVYVDFSQEAYDLWVKAVSLHWFVTGSTSFPYLEYYKHLARVRGIEARKEFAETFMIPEESMRLRQSEL
ncbi:PIG-L family deacetylase [Paenibacillus thiaminolyticus]|uniref:PIG-L family deacetylase n=1 Tax=Paenibacillus thiaminolyticus TaxID=49283 RepID=A0AAP9J113_PANTH|nr:PIG-L family deacetylase [Paenibacillus thiaminolyticus]MCY9537605.1 PIG-L family deacetylase [Paenibacillus thiaminolyticus]MCY9600718.1 PIG-L family deacetylase [Paenibacillus thiaminolyticus]MCY9607546.1 PIG-L family deacetylase [Paenibacillus thiaminolyticus]MCY9611346.1 PIG-L family deacetylase [Paenibacillus thiaminolyticus]MCY9617383.1 PIG-L family deacetylase [Paenibacillus thiaminolyticus]